MKSLRVAFDVLLLAGAIRVVWPIARRAVPQFKGLDIGPPELRNASISIGVDGIGLVVFLLLLFASFASWTRRAPAVMRWVYGMAGIGFVFGSVASYSLAKSWMETSSAQYVLFVAAYAIVAAPIVVLGRGYPFLIMDLIRIVRRRFGDRAVQATVCANCGYDLRGATGEQRCPECGAMARGETR